MVYREYLEFHTEGDNDMTDLTEEVSGIIKRSGISNGICHVFNIGSTGAIGTIEFEPGLQGDFPKALMKLIPESKEYRHEFSWHDGNGHSHIQASLIGPEITVPVIEGHLRSGTWQQVFHYEADNKPHDRKIIVTVIGE
jgi:secondary thiamine-phosphate synthase enzyme